MVFKIGLLTCAAIPQLAGEDLGLLKELKGRGHQAVPVVWNNPDADWSSFDCLVFRSVWDYQRNIIAFREFLQQLENSAIRCFNSVAVVSENLDKHYLQKLEKAAVQIIPSIFIENGNEIPDVFKHWDTAEIIAKPAVSAGSYNLHKFSWKQKEELDAFILHAGAGYIIQPFMSEIMQEGELSFVFIDGKFSHAMRKLPKENEFRVQKEFGGRDIPFLPEKSQIQYAKKSLDVLCPDSLYARVDCLMIEGVQYIMEVELFEPLLYLDSEESLQKFAIALETKLATA